MPRIKHAKPCLSGLLLAAAVLCTQAARADVTLWYNGDLDQRDAFINQTGTPDGLIYDNFIVPTGFTYLITGVFSNDVLVLNSPPSTAYWEIRSGVSAGNGGTLIASGDGADTVTATGRTFNALNLAEYKNLVSGLNITLSAGTYWLTVAPDVSSVVGIPGSSITTTSGANAIGMPPGNDGNSFFSSTAFGNTFTPTSDPSVEGSGTWDYSMGIIGTSSPTVVPEPSTVIVGLVGMGMGAACAWRRRRARS